MHYDDDISEKSFNLRTWAAMGPFFRPWRGMVAKALLLMLVCSLIDVFIPLYQKYFIDAFIVPRRTDGILAATVVGVLVMVVSLVCVVLFTRMAIRVEMGFSRDLKKACFDHLQTLSLSYYNTTPVGYIIARVLSDTDKIGLLIAWGLVDLMWGLSYVVFAVVAMLLLDFRLGLWVAVMMPIMAAVTTWFQNRILRHNRKVRRTNSLITGSFNEGILGARTSKTLVIEDISAAEFSGLTGEMYRASVRAAALSAIYTPVMMGFGALAVSMMLIQGSGYVQDGSMAFGTLSAMISYAVGIFEPIQHLSRFFSDATSTQANIERVDALLNQKPEITDAPEVREIYGDSFSPRRENWEPIVGGVRFDDVSFKYPDGDEYVLSHFSLGVPAGTCVAIVGETGAGKSTLVNLVCRFFEPVSGRILIDGRDYRERSQLWLHSNIGCVLQSPHLFSGTVRDNIRYGRLDATDAEIMEAARLVSADSVLAKLPMGLDSDVGEGGDRLSTGEKQLISFARAVLADPRIFILDEATSSIDTETERLIQNAIAKVLSGRTSFLIAHRLSTIRAADLILVVQDGKIVEQGTHRELLRKKGRYLKLWAMQYEEDIISQKQEENQRSQGTEPYGFA
ncbi:MAG: ABC transporter ATP-binding protein/permease [Synergistaceae bacterium]|jgi:ATP-binding cassette subfamily B protein|nr:ABC transporter ATP-binding protein/permease [Synergistaceae bacterium]